MSTRRAIAGEGLELSETQGSTDQGREDAHFERNVIPEFYPERPSYAIPSRGDWDVHGAQSSPSDTDGGSVLELHPCVPVARPNPESDSVGWILADRHREGSETAMGIYSQDTHTFRSNGGQILRNRTK
jgi:hypothetical protein